MIFNLGKTRVFLIYLGGKFIDLIGKTHLSDLRKVEFIDLKTLIDRYWGKTPVG